METGGGVQVWVTVYSFDFAVYILQILYRFFFFYSSRFYVLLINRLINISVIVKSVLLINIILFFLSISLYYEQKFSWKLGKIDFSLLILR